jgi:hypothetical protein
MRHILPVTAVLLASASGALAQDATDYSMFVPTTELYTATGEPPETALVQRLFTLAFTEPCGPAIDGGYGGPEPQVFDFTYRGSYDEPTDPERKFRLYQFNCSGGAYNFSSVFYGWDEIDGLKPLSFAAPTVKPTYEDEDQNPDGKLVGLQWTGMDASFLVTNAQVDTSSGAIASAAYWRGIGDASSLGTWVLSDGRYVLDTYDVDASYDGEVNPVRLYDLSSPIDIELP